jgi:hypothetical protein
VLNDSDETVCDDGHMDLNTHRIASSAEVRGWLQPFAGCVHQRRCHEMLRV